MRIASTAPAGAPVSAEIPQHRPVVRTTLLAAGLKNDYSGYNATALSSRDDDFLQSNQKCLSKERLEHIYLYYGLASPTARGPRVSVFDNERIFRSIVLFDSNFTVRYKGSGVFVGVDSVVEYMSLGNGDLNGGNFDVVMNDIDNITCIDDDSMYVKATSTVAMIDSSDLSKSTNDDYHVFAPEGSPLLVKVDTIVPQVLLDGVVSAEISRQTFCDTAVLRCPGELYPYRNLQECYDKMASMHSVCEDGANDIDYTGGAFQGDTVACRFLHLLSSGLRPVYHCPHMRDVSEKCKPEHCLSASERLKVPVEVNKFFDPGYSTWFLIPQLGVLSILTMFVAFSYIRFRRARVGITEKFDGEDMDFEDDHHLQNHDDNTLPSLMFKDLQLSRKNSDDHESAASKNVVLNVKQNFLGGCPLTAITAPSGTGKTTLMRLLCGFEESHMELSVGEWLRKDPMSYCPQHANMYPHEMPVKDIIYFASNLANVDPVEYHDFFHILGINELMDQSIGTLSGGQLQRVNICATIIRPTPSVIFLDEPLAALDQENALHCLTALKMLPVKHSFVVTVHDPSPKVQLMFDRIVHLDSKRRITMVDSKKPIATSINLPILEVDDKKYRRVNKKSTHFRGSVKASFILWFSQFYGIPLVEVVVILCTICGAVFAGFLARKSTADWTDYLPTNEGVRLPFYMADILVAMSLISSFGGSLIYGQREREIINHFVTIRTMDPLAYLLTTGVRCAVQGILQAGLWVFIFLPILGLPLRDSLSIFVTCSVFGFGWIGFTFAASFICPVAYYAHLLMVLNMYCAFFSGVFFIWSRLYGFFKVLHYFNPLFYTLSAMSYTFLNNVDTGCSETQHPGECASGTRLLEMAEVVPFSSLGAQGVNLVLWFVAFAVSLHQLHSKATEKYSKTPRVQNDANVSFRMQQIIQFMRAQFVGDKSSEVPTLKDWKQLSHRNSLIFSESFKNVTKNHSTILELEDLFDSEESGTSSADNSILTNLKKQGESFHDNEC
uniref:ABC transporter domain-containing protein n=1 Tax=Chaetoceros debilis TaxID=122233 RepID=A0A7S3Q180_9STRA